MSALEPIQSSEVYREETVAILHREDYPDGHVEFKVMADARTVAWTDYIVRLWVNLALYRLTLPYEVDSVHEQDYARRDLWRWFVVSVIKRRSV